MTGNTAEPTEQVSWRHSGHRLFLSPPKLKSASSPHTAIPPPSPESHGSFQAQALVRRQLRAPWEGNAPLCAHPRGQKELIHQPEGSPRSPGSTAMKCL